MTRARDVSNIDGLLTTKGDIYAATGAGVVVRQGVGSDGQVLTANSAQADGLEWATPAAGGMTLLSTTTLSGTSTTISGISGSYTDLYVFMYGVNINTSGTVLRIAINGSTSLGYYQRNNASGGLAAISANYLYLVAATTNVANGRTDNVWQFRINNYASTTTLKGLSGTGIYYDSNQADLYSLQLGGGINTTSAITSFEISNNAGNSFAAGTVLIYGVK